jgi:putative membrane protein insertion efficiency factor
VTAIASRIHEHPVSQGSPAIVTPTRENRAGLGQTLLLLPRNACIAVLSLYRAAISPLYGDVCKYYPSCSRYALEAIQQHGMLRGIWLGSKRLARCHPWAAGGIDDVPACEHATPAVGRLGFVSGLERG